MGSEQSNNQGGGVDSGGGDQKDAGGGDSRLPSLRVSFDVFTIACCRMAPGAYVPAGILECAFRAYLREAGVLTHHLGKSAGLDLVMVALGEEGLGRVRLVPADGGDSMYVGISLERWPSSTDVIR